MDADFWSVVLITYGGWEVLEGDDFPLLLGGDFWLVIAVGPSICWMSYVVLYSEVLEGVSYDVVFLFSTSMFVVEWLVE